MENQIEAVTNPEVRLVFDPKTQSVQVGIKNMANLDFALMMLEGAKVSLTFQRNMMMGQQMEAQQMEVRKAQSIANSLRNGGPIR